MSTITCGIDSTYYPDQLWTPTLNTRVWDFTLPLGPSSRQLLPNDGNHTWQSGFSLKIESVDKGRM